MDSFRFDDIYENGYYYVLQPIDDVQLGAARERHYYEAHFI